MYFSDATTRNLVDTLAPGRSHRPKGKGKGASSPSLSLAQLLKSRPGSASLQGALARQLNQNANRTPEAVMKVTGKQGSAQHLRANLAYIGREERDQDQHVELEDERGQRVEGKAGIRQLANEWSEHNEKGGDRRKGAVSRSMVLSSPRGSDPQKVLEAAREWAHKELGDRRWVMALHTDTPNPHVHITYAIRDNNLVRSYPDREGLAKQREAWARELRAKGIEVIATPRQARGVVEEKESTAQRRQKDDGKAADRSTSRYLRYMAAQRDKVIDVFRSALADLKQSAEPDAPDIAKSLSTFVAGLEQDAARDRGEPARAAPPDRVLPTEREQILAETRDEISYRGRFTDRAPGVAGQGLPERSEEREASAAPATAPPERDAAERQAPGRQDSRSGAEEHVVRLSGIDIDLRGLEPDQAEYVRQLAEEERRENTVTLEGVEIDLRGLEPDQARYIKEAAQEEVAKQQAASPAQTTQKQPAPPTPKLQEWAIELERSIKEREKDRDRGGPSR